MTKNFLKKYGNILIMILSVLEEKAELELNTGYGARPEGRAFWPADQEMFVICLEFLVEMVIFLKAIPVYYDCQISSAFLLHW